MSSAHATRLRHGGARQGSRTHEYRCWQCMKARCQNPNDTNFDRYGARGVEVCERWQSFDSFLADMGQAPTSKHTIDRIDNDKGYSPDNCRWASPAEQQQNRTNTKLDAAKVADIRRRLTAGESDLSIANLYGVHRSTVGYIRCGHTWRNVADASGATSHG